MNTSGFMRNVVLMLIFGTTSLLSASLDAVTVSGASAPAFVDSTSPSSRLCRGAVKIAYSPQYADETANDTAYVTISTVDTRRAVTNLLVKCPAGAGFYDYEPVANADMRVRLLMRAYDTTDAALGKPLDADFVLPIASGAAAEGSWVDTRANSLQELAEAGGTAPFAYDTKWATNGVPASLKISCERSVV